RHSVPRACACISARTTPRSRSVRTTAKFHCRSSRTRPKISPPSRLSAQRILLFGVGDHTPYDNRGAIIVGYAFEAFSAEAAMGARILAVTAIAVWIAMPADAAHAAPSDKPYSSNAHRGAGGAYGTLKGRSPQMRNQG